MHWTYYSCALSHRCKPAFYVHRIHFNLFFCPFQVLQWLLMVMNLRTLNCGRLVIWRQRGSVEAPRDPPSTIATGIWTTMTMPRMQSSWSSVGTLLISLMDTVLIVSVRGSSVQAMAVRVEICSETLWKTRSLCDPPLVRRSCLDIQVLILMPRRGALL